MLIVGPGLSEPLDQTLLLVQNYQRSTHSFFSGERANQRRRLAVRCICPVLQSISFRSVP
jgi:hypothetical protein